MNELDRIRRPRPGRLPMLTLFAGATSSLAVPWVPTLLTERVRGAIVHDIARRAGLALVPEARQVLAATVSEEETLRPIVRALRLSVARRLFRWVPLVSFLPAALAAFSAFALGHLFERYLVEVRTDTATRIGVDEAKNVRRKIDYAVTKALTLKRDGSTMPKETGEDLRDAMTQVLDSMLIGAATLPAWLVERLDRAFDDALRS